MAMETGMVMLKMEIVKMQTTMAPIRPVRTGMTHPAMMFNQNNPVGRATNSPGESSEEGQ
jgi:hypothetical protein